MSDFEVRALGDRAVLVTLAGETNQTVARAWQVADAVRAAMSGYVLDVVPAYSSVLVRFNAETVDLARVLAGVRGAAERSSGSTAVSHRLVTIRAQFGGEAGCDLEDCARQAGITEEAFVASFCRATYRVAFLGFIAGFPYLTGLPDGLRRPRLASPRPRVAAGSIGIAGAQCGIYPRSSPGGWRLIGRTSAVLFDPWQESPALFAPGDTVRFQACNSPEETSKIDVSAAGAGQP